MTQATGALARVLMGFQADVETIATAGFVMPFNSSDLKGGRNQFTPGTMRGNLNPTEPSDGNKSVAGQLVVPVDSVALWYWLKAAFGAPTTSGTGPYIHTFKAGDPDAPRPYITIEHQYTDLDTPQYFQYVGCKVNTWAWSMGEDGEFVATLDIVGCSETASGTSFDSTPTTVTMARLKNNQMTLKEGGSAINTAKMLDCSIGWKCDTTQYVIGGGGVLGSVPDGVMEVKGNLSALFDSMTLLTKALNSTESSLEATFTASSTSALTVLMPEVKYTPNSPGIPGPQGIAISLPYGAYYDNSTQKTSVQVALTNSEAHA